MQISISTYANEEIISKTLEQIQLHHNGELVASWPITATVDVEGVDLNEIAFATEFLTKAKSEIDRVEFHSTGLTLFEEETLYGPTIGYAIKSSSNNIMFVAIANYKDEDPILLLAYEGTRGGLDFLARGNSVLTRDDLKVLASGAEDDIILYETNGPKDMLFWETKSEYVNRVGGVLQETEVRNSIMEIITTGITDVIVFGEYEESNVLTNYYTHHSGIGTNANTILRQWINVADAKVRDKRATQVKNIIGCYVLASNLLNAI